MNVLTVNEVNKNIDDALKSGTIDIQSIFVLSCKSVEYRA